MFMTKYYKQQENTSSKVEIFPRYYTQMMSEAEPSILPHNSVLSFANNLTLSTTETHFLASNCVTMVELKTSIT